MIIIYLTYRTGSLGRGSIGISDEETVAIYEHPLWQATDCVWIVPEMEGTSTGFHWSSE